MNKSVKSGSVFIKASDNAFAFYQYVEKALDEMKLLGLNPITRDQSRWTYRQ